MARIQLLSSEVASHIAAGEVVERPASLLKELLENSLDAGASRVTVEVLGAGKKSLRVVDDGCGMDPADLELCLKRHATSKIKATEDLEKLTTFGFRGEALYAIAAVSRFSITSCPRQAKTGWRVEAQGGAVTASCPAPAVPGTVVEAKDLFFNTPARLKFLRSDAFEKSQLSAVMEEAALANPEAGFLYKSEGRRLMSFAPESGADAAEKDRRRLAAVMGDELAAGLLPISAERPGIRLRLFVSPAGAMAATRRFQLWFVNRRPVAARVLQQALYRAFDAERGSGRHPVVVGHLELNPDAFDVNVHPGKREVRFRSERELFELVSGLIASGLAKAKTAAPITPMPRGGFPILPGPAGAVREAPPAFYLGGRSFFPEEPRLGLQSGPAAAVAAPEGAPRWYTPPYRYLGQVERSYLVFEAAGGLFVLDQHAAAERVLFERYLAEIEKGTLRTQRLMLPIPVELPASAAQAVLAKKARLRRLGFELEPFGKTVLHMTAVPALFHKAADIKDMVHRLLDSLEDPVEAAREVVHDAVATIACKAAVKAHDPLGEKEALALLEQLKDCADGSCCPHGRRALLALNLNREELARRFQRPGAPPL